MCGRFSQYPTAIEYLEALRYDKSIESGINPAPIGRYKLQDAKSTWYEAQDRQI